MQEKLERKLLAALQRKENIIAARARKASGKVSLSVERGQSAIKQKDMLVEKMKAQSQDKLESAKDRRRRLQKLAKEKREVNMMRRVMTQAMQDAENKSITSLQEKLDRKYKNANERKRSFLTAKASRAADCSSISDRSQESSKQMEVSDLKKKSQMKHESAAKRKALLIQQEEKKKAIRRKKREYALEFARQKKLEQDMIMKWESRSVVSQDRLPALDETAASESFDAPNFNETNDEVVDWNEEKDEEAEYDDLVLNGSEETYDDKKIAARRLLVEELRLANEAKAEELTRIGEERKEQERKERERADLDQPELLGMSRNVRGTSVGTIGSIDTTDLCSFDEEDMSISGLSTVREEESKVDRRKAQAALALAELDIKLSEIQIMQAILLAEEASLSGASEFKTSEKSITQLNSVKVTVKVTEGENGIKKVTKSASNFFNHTLKSAKEAQQRAGATIGQMRQKGIFRRAMNSSHRK